MHERVLRPEEGPRASVFSAAVADLETFEGSSLSRPPGWQGWDCRSRLTKSLPARSLGVD